MQRKYKKIKCMLFSEKNVYDIMSPKEKQAAAQQTFVFHGPLTKVSPAQQAVERVSACP
jgi:hypothetical protein